MKALREANKFTQKDVSILKITDKQTTNQQ